VFVVYYMIIWFVPMAALDIPRFSQNLNEESDNMADYDIIKCNGEGDDRSCSMNADGWIEYSQTSVGFYTGINLIGIVFVFMGTFIYLVYILCRCCCRCCGYGRKKNTGETIAPMDSNSEPVEIVKIKKLNPLKLVCICLGILGIVIMCILSTVLGNTALTESSSGIVNAPAGAQQISQDIEPQLTEVMIQIMSTVVVPAMISLNETINSAINVPQMTASMLTLNESLPELPDVGEMLDVLYNIDNITTGNVTTDLVDELSDLLDELIVDKERVEELINLLGDDVDTMSSSNNDMLEAIDRANDTIIATEMFVSEVIGTDNDEGLAAEVHRDLTAIQRSPEGTIPPVDVFDEASDGEYGSTRVLISGGMDGNSSQVQLMNDKLSVIYTNMSSLPNYTVTANNIVALNDTINDALGDSGILSNITDSLLALESVVDSYPALNITASYVNELYTIVQSVDEDLDTAIDILQELYDLFDGLPSDLAILYREVEAVRVISDILSAFEVLTDQLTGVNETLVELPSSLGSLTDVYADINETASDIVNDVDDMLDDIVSANDTVVGYLDDAIAYMEDISEMDDQLNSSLREYDFVAFNDTIYDAKGYLEAVDFNSTLSAVQSLRTTLESLSLTYNLVDALLQFQLDAEAIVSLLQRAVDTTNGGADGSSMGDYLSLAGGYCSDNDAVYCEDDGPCVGSCVGKGSYRCANEGSIPCSEDSNCTSHCLADSSRASDLHTRLVALSSTDGDIDVSSELSSLEDVLSSSNLDLDSARDAIDSSASVVSAVNLSDINAMLSIVRDGLDQYNATGAVGDLDFNFADLGITDIIDLLEPFEDDVDDLNDEYLPIVRDYSSTMVAFRDFLFTELHGHVDNFSAATLNAKVSSSGPNAMVKFIASQVDSITQYFDENQDGVKVEETDFSDDVGNSFEVLDKMGAYDVSGFGDMDEHGAMYYLLRLLRNGSVVHWDYPMLMGVFVNSENEKYSNGDVCVTEKCEDHTLEVLNSEPMSSWNDEFPDVDMSALESVEYSREELLTMLWIAPLCIVFFGLLSALFHAVQKYQMAENVFNSCFLGCILCQLPIIFLLTAFFFAFAILINDGCNSWTAIGELYITSYGDPFCANILDGNGTLSECLFDTNIPDSMGGGNITVTVDVLSWYRGIFADDCAGRPDPFATLLRSLADQTDDIPPGAVDHMLEENELNLRDPLLDIIDAAAVNTGTVIHNFLDSLAEEVLTCDKVSAVVASVDRETCDSFAPPILWIVAPWYLCAWLICCLALPGACMSAKQKETRRVSPALAKEVNDEDEEAPIEEWRNNSENESPRSQRSDRQGSRENADGVGEGDNAESPAPIPSASPDPVSTTIVDGTKMDLQDLSNSSTLNQDDVEKPDEKAEHRYPETML